MQAYSAAYEMVNDWGFAWSSVSLLEGNLSFTVAHQGHHWQLEVYLEEMPFADAYHLSSQFTAQTTVLFWTGGLICCHDDWELLRDELLNIWVRRGLDLEAEGLSGDETEIE